MRLSVVSEHHNRINIQAIDNTIKIEDLYELAKTYKDMNCELLDYSDGKRLSLYVKYNNTTLLKKSLLSFLSQLEKMGFKLEKDLMLCHQSFLEFLGS